MLFHSQWKKTLLHSARVHLTTRHFSPGRSAAAAVRRCGARARASAGGRGGGLHHPPRLPGSRVNGAGLFSLGILSSFLLFWLMERAEHTDQAASGNALNTRASADGECPAGCRAKTRVSFWKGTGAEQPRTLPLRARAPAAPPSAGGRAVAEARVCRDNARGWSAGGTSPSWARRWPWALTTYTVNHVYAEASSPWGPAAITPTSATTALAARLLPETGAGRWLARSTETPGTVPLGTAGTSRNCTPSGQRPLLSVPLRGPETPRLRRSQADGCPLPQWLDAE